MYYNNNNNDNDNSCCEDSAVYLHLCTPILLMNSILSSLHGERANFYLHVMD